MNGDRGSNLLHTMAAGMDEISAKFLKGAGMC